MKIAIVGQGKLGSALDTALRIAGHEVIDDHLLSDVIVICVPDDAIAEVSERFAGHPMAHTSGAHPASILRGNGLKASMHPIQTFRAGADGSEFNGIHVSLEGDDGLLDRLETVVLDLGAMPLRVTPAQKASIHLAAVMVSNFSVALHLAADDVLKDAGIRTASVELFAALMDQTLRNIKAVGPWNARTGPASRGDLETMSAHLALLERRVSVSEAYKALSDILRGD